KSTRCPWFGIPTCNKFIIIFPDDLGIQKRDTVIVIFFFDGYFKRCQGLFNNITTELTITSIEKHWNAITQHCKISKKEFLNLINFLFDTTVFSFNNVIYKQTLGMPMGSPVSPILAQYVMDDLLESCLNQLPFEIPFLKKYVDDIILTIPQGSTQTLLQVFNSYHPRLQFTIEEEDDNHSVPFLDTKVIRKDDNKLITKFLKKRQ
ncbi:hypothetical protein NQ317_012907, partial [Molorchus minor]